MYPVSDAFLQAIESNARSYYWTGEIVTVNHSTYEFGNEDIVKGSGYITRSACGSSEIELGAVYAAELGTTLFSSIDRYTLDGAEIRLFFHLNLADGTVESIPMGVFEVSEANRTVKCLELKAYDYMLRFDKTLNIESSSGTPYNFLHTICTECKVAMAQTQAEIDALPNGRETLAFIRITISRRSGTSCIMWRRCWAVSARSTGRESWYCSHMEIHRPGRSNRPNVMTAATRIL